MAAHQRRGVADSHGTARLSARAWLLDDPARRDFIVRGLPLDAQATPPHRGVVGQAPEEEYLIPGFHFTPSALNGGQSQRARRADWLKLAGRRGASLLERLVRLQFAQKRSAEYPRVSGRALS